MAPMKAAPSLPLPMRPAGFLLPSLGALALASCAAPPSPPPPTASVLPPAPQQQAPPPPQAQAELGLVPLPTPAQVKAAVAAQRVENENSQLSGSEADLTDYANKQISLAKIYLSKTQGHLDSAKQAALSRDIPSSCNDFKAAAGSATAIFNSVEPVAKEIKLKRPEMIDSILANGQTLVDNIEVALAECERLGF